MFSRWQFSLLLEDLLVCFFVVLITELNTLADHVCTVTPINDSLYWSICCSVILLFNRICKQHLVTMVGGLACANIVGRVNEVTQRWAGLVLRWVTIHGCAVFIFDQAIQANSAWPSLHRRQNEYWRWLSLPPSAVLCHLYLHRLACL